MNAKEHLKKLESLHFDEQKIEYLSSLDEETVNEIFREDSKNKIKN